ncbi:transporter, partial [Methanobrevibacter sp. OttesenSCG-928-I08]|nr:transporter [Methanobrevibacter sp. OttesenSCG-928-I08]
MLNKTNNYIFLHGVLFVYAICALIEKYTAGFNISSPDFYLFCVIVFIFLGIYAILWQQVLKRIDLNIAYANKSITVIWGILFGFLIFGETIT